MRRLFKKAIYLVALLGLAAFLLVACSKEQTTKVPAPEKKEGSAKESSPTTPTPRAPTSASQVFEQDLSISNGEIDSAVNEIDSVLKDIDGIDRSQDNEPKL